MKSIFKLITKIIIVILFIAFLAVAYVCIDGYLLYQDVISKTSIEDTITLLRESENYVEKENIPASYFDAVVAIEDKRFYEHNGFDIISTGRAMITNVLTLSLSEGGSSITQQLAKNLYFSQEKKFTRKVAELFVAMDIENYLNDKDEILELYVNKIYYGDGYTGIYDASIGYFNKSPEDLTIYEQTLLAGLPNAPSVYALSNNSEHSYQRQNQVVDAMISEGTISDTDALEIKETNSYIFDKLD